MFTRKPFAVFLLVLLAAGLLLDVQTDRQLVMAIFYAVPVALSSLAYSNRLTTLVVIVALAATFGVGFGDLMSESVTDAFALLNRALAALSFTLVGGLVVVLNRSSERVRLLEREEARAARESELRRLLTELSRFDSADDLLTAAASGLLKLFGATRVVISGTEGGRLCAPHYAAPSSGAELCEGHVTPWVAALPTAAPRVASARIGGKLLTAGWVERAGGDLLILIATPTAKEPCALLTDVVGGLEPLLAHAERLEKGAQGRPAPRRKTRTVFSSS